MSHHHIRSEPGLWTAGFYDPEGKFVPDSDWPSEDAARARVHFLNGGERQEADVPAPGAREWYAGQALKGLLATPMSDGSAPGVILYVNGGKLSWNHHNYPVNLAKLAFDMADAMLAEAAKKGG